MGQAAVKLSHLQLSVSSPAPNRDVLEPSAPRTAPRPRMRSSPDRRRAVLLHIGTLPPAARPHRAPRSPGRLRSCRRRRRYHSRPGISAGTRHRIEPPSTPEGPRRTEASLAAQFPPCKVGATEQNSPGATRLHLWQRRGQVRLGPAGLRQRAQRHHEVVEVGVLAVLEGQGPHRILTGDVQTRSALEQRGLHLGADLGPGRERPCE